MDIVQFINDRLDEDEAAAKMCAEMFPAPWDVADRGWRVRIYAGDVPTPDHSVDDEDAMTTRNPVVMEVEPDRNLDDPHWLSERVEMVRRHDPARVLREVAAKRAILEAYEQWPVLIEGPPEFEQSGDLASITMRMSQQVQWVTTQEYAKRFGAQPPAAPMVRTLAAVYADHPDYDPEWR